MKKKAIKANNFYSMFIIFLLFFSFVSITLQLDNNFVISKNAEGVIKPICTGGYLQGVKQIYHVYPKQNIVSQAFMKLFSAGMSKARKGAGTYTLYNFTANFSNSVTSLVGPTGSGKSTLAKVILGIEPVSEGNMIMSSRSTPSFTLAQASSTDAYSIRSFRIDAGTTSTSSAGFAMDNNKHLGLVDNFFESTYNIRSSVKKVIGFELEGVSEFFALKLLSLFNIPVDCAVTSLLESQKKTFEIILCLSRCHNCNICPPYVLVLDEYLDNCSRGARQQIHQNLKLLNQLEDAQLQTILITHSQSICLECSDRCIVLNNGYKVYEGDPKNIVVPPQHIWIS